jgi:anti-sigma factor RsiW
MSTVQTHPDEGLLLRYLDGEAPGRRVRQVRRHLEACWECRAGAEDLERTIAACVRYRQQVLQAHLPAPPAAWADLSRGFARIDAEVAAASWTARVRQWLKPSPAVRWAASAAAVLALAAGLYYQFHETPSVQAAALLRRAVVAGEAHPAPARRIQVRTPKAKFWLGDRAAAAEVAGMFRAARYDFDDPLSARSYSQWRDSLAEKRDEVRTVADPVEPGKACYEIRTVAAAGPLASASLMLRTADLLPVEGRFEFRDQDWVELTGFPEVSATEGGTPATTRLETPLRRAEPSRPAAVPSGSSASISEELRVLAALHAIGADLGDPVEVKLEDGKVLVSGVGVPAERQREIRARLDAIPGVEIDFADAPAGVGQADAGLTPPAASEVPKAAPLEARIEKQLGGRVEFERFSAQMLDWTEAAMARAYALHALAERFPAVSEARMSTQDRGLLDDLAREHVRHLSARIDSLNRTLAPVLVALGGPQAPAQGRPTGAQAWQPAAEEAYRAARRAERLISLLMGATAEKADSRNAPADLLAALTEARAALADCEKALR